MGGHHKPYIYNDESDGKQTEDPLARQIEHTENSILAATYAFSAQVEILRKETQSAFRSLLLWLNIYALVILAIGAILF